MSGHTDNSNLVRSWRDIPQEVRSRAMSKTGRRRYMMATAKVVCGSAFIALLGWGTWELISTVENNPRQIAKATEAGPLKDVALLTDGVLNKDWVARTLGIPKTATLMELDITKLYEKVLASGQVKSAVIAKNFPASLSVSCSERVPVARVMVQDTEQVKTTYLVARDGVLFKGECYDEASLEALPWLDGVRIARKGGSLAPIEGMEIVADLLHKAKNEARHLYPFFNVVNVARLQSDGEIDVRSPECESLVFGTNEDFFRQLAWLDSICDMVKPSAEAPLAKIDLSLGRNLPVTYRQILPSSLQQQQPGQQQQTQRQAQPAASKDTQAPKREVTPVLFNLKRNKSAREL